MNSAALIGSRVHHRGNFGSDPRDGKIVEVDDRNGMIKVQWDGGRVSWELQALLGLPSGLQFIKAAKDLIAGDYVVERDGASLEVTKVERSGRMVFVHVARYGSIPVNPIRVRASADVNVARPAWL